MLYMALILNNLGYMVLIADRSRRRELADILTCELTQEGLVTYRNLDFYMAADRREEENFVRQHQYSYVFDYVNEPEGDVIADVTKAGYDGIIINTSCLRSELRVSREIVMRAGVKVLVVIRDMPENIPKLKYIEKYYMNNVGICSLYAVPPDICDKEYQYKMDYEGIRSYRAMSSGYSCVLSKCICEISGRDDKSVKRALRYLKEGKIFDNRLLE